MEGDCKLTLSHNKHKKEQQERGERQRLISLKAVSKRGWKRARARARQKRKQAAAKA